MKKYICYILKYLSCIIFWLTISPLFYYFAKRWGLMKKWVRIVFLCISPFFLISYLLIMYLALLFYFTYQNYHKFDDKERVGRIIGTTLPKYKIINRDVGNFSFNGDYSVTLDLEFKEVPSEEFYLTLDSVTAVDYSGWKKNGDCYTYGEIWGKGLPVPKGENRYEGINFDLYICKGKKYATINYKSW